ncbi:MAG: COX15/CtaA family protein [Ignavibacteriae bacterium]|nr:COX15/CtaA family protein [Ignavibacteriota bacterium]
MSSPSYNKGLHWFAVFTAVCTLFLIVVGGLVTSTGSGLAVPDWPLSYGQVMPPMVGGIFYEHGHRMVATTVGFLTIILAVWLSRKEQRRWLRRLGWFALALVIVQGALGGLTVLFLLPTAISASHATIAQTFFCVVSSIALFTSKWWLNLSQSNTQQNLDSNLITLSILTVCVIYIQLILGAVMRHTGSGLAVPDFPLAYGQLIPSLTPESLEQYNRQLIYADIRLAAEGAITAGQIVIHLLHRVWAIVVTGVILILSMGLYKQKLPLLKSYANILLALVTIQVTLGMLTVLTRKSVEIATAHVAVGAALLAFTVLLALSILRLSGRFHFEVSLAGQTREAIV